MKGPRRIGVTVEKLLCPSSIYCMSCGCLIDETRTYSLCDACIQRFSWVGDHTCQKCGKPLPQEAGNRCYDCLTGTHVFRQGYTCASYGLYERMLVSNFKERGQAYIAKPLAQIFRDRMVAAGVFVEASPKILDVEEEKQVTAPYDLLIPVPADGAKEQERGYNQAALIARELGELVEVPVEEGVLLRHRSTQSMRHLGAEERRANVRQAFSVVSGAEKILKDKKILLLDDVYTTGSTADACAQTLLDSGARWVDVLTLAAGGNRPPK